MMLGLKIASSGLTIVVLMVMVIQVSPGTDETPMWFQTIVAILLALGVVAAFVGVFMAVWGL
ncbi:MAG: hypothetical protein GY853_13545 [PVC group bacterium]|nr:hypothetical protein [PVC group bacterium]